PMDAETIKVFWPEGISSALRGAVVERLASGRLKEGKFRIASGQGGAATGLSLYLEAENLAIRPAPDLPPFTIPSAVLTREGDRLEIAVPEGEIVAAPNRRVTVK